MSEVVRVIQFFDKQNGQETITFSMPADDYLKILEERKTYKEALETIKQGKIKYPNGLTVELSEYSMMDIARRALK